MVLLSFSEEKHVPLILNGRKRQTTRQKWKNPVTPGDRLQVYYKSRVSKTCLNCIVNNCQYSATGNSVDIPGIKCTDHTNFFGEAVVTSVETVCFDQMTSEQREAWAIADGFDSWIDAALWFTRNYSKKFGVWSWKEVPWTVIKFEPEWLKVKEAI